MTLEEALKIINHLIDTANEEALTDDEYEAIKVIYATGKTLNEFIKEESYQMEVFDGSDSSYGTEETMYIANYGALCVHENVLNNIGVDIDEYK